MMKNLIVLCLLILTFLSLVNITQTVEVDDDSDIFT